MKKFLMILGMAIAAMTITGCGQINSDEVGFKTSWGKIDSQPLTPGLYCTACPGTDLVKYTCRDQRSDKKMAAYTKDAQTATCQVSTLYTINPALVTELHTKYGPKYAQTIIDPVVLKAVKNVIGKWDSIELIAGREKANAELDSMVKALVSDGGKCPIVIKDVAFTDIEYTDVFEKAIEEKMIAAQDAIKAKNRTVQIEEEARQKLIIAESEAKSMQIKGDALRANQGLVELEAIQKWDGKMPNTLCVGDGAKTFLPVK